MEKSGYVRTDLAFEERERLSSGGREPEGIEFEEEVKGEWKIARLRIVNEKGAKLLGKPVGGYATVCFGAPVGLNDGQKEALSGTIGEELARFMREKGVDFSSGPVLAAGLGNRRLAVDAVGPAAISKMTVTNHLRKLDPALFARLGQRATAAICPGVLGDTGMESAEVIAAVCGALRPCAVIVVDALAAGSRERLLRAVQISDAGICPGSGVGNDRPALTKETLGAPVFSLGVPTVVDLRTLICEALEGAGVNSARVLPPPEGEGFFVAPKDADASVEIVGDVLADGIDRALRAG